jgi:BirA family biotin operon repressor/biotin-[acetyl-CoA-carboxylase] ligase
MVNLRLLENSLNLSTLDLQVHFFEEVDSTNLEAKRMITSGLDQDLLLIATKQSAGRGRVSRTWYSPEGGLYFSLITKPRLGTQFAPLHSLLCGCAVAKGIQSLGIEKVQLKWPNDVLVMEDKIAGILNELISVDSKTSWIILGVGINQNITIRDFPEELTYISTSIQDILGKKTSPELLLSNIITELDELLVTAETEQSFNSILRKWKNLSGTLGRRVRVDDGNQVYSGIAETLLDDGSLVVLTENGREKITIGDVTHLRSD